MPIILDTPFVPPAPSYDKIHLDHLTITLERTNYAKTQIQARVRLYYQDPDTGDKTFSPDTRDISITDGEQWMMSLAIQGDMRGIEVANAIKQLVALLVATETDLGNASIS